MLGDEAGIRLVVKKRDQIRQVLLGWVLVRQAETFPKQAFDKLFEHVL